MSLEKRPAAVQADPPASDRPDRVAERSGGRDGEVRGKARLELPAEEDDALPGESAGGDSASVHHHRLAGRGQDRVDGHQQKDGVEPVVADDGGEEIGDLAQNRGDRHGRGLYPGDATGFFFAEIGAARITRNTCVVSSTAPSSFVARNRICKGRWRRTRGRRPLSLSSAR